MDREVWIGASWKMNNTLAEAHAFAGALTATTIDRRIQPFVVPPFTVLREVKAELAATRVKVAAQNMHWDEAGAWTGEISAPMLVDCGVDMVEIGHSERRLHFGETDETVERKVAAALRHGLTPLVCVGETAEEKAAGRADRVLARQVSAALGLVDDPASILFAYEPVWAIGEGAEAASPGYADERHGVVKAVGADMLGAAPRVLYSGSVGPANCQALLARPNIDGLMVGRAAWAPEGYIDILNRAAAAL